MWQIIRDLVACGVTFFLTTQYLEVADQLADSIAVLDHSKIVAQETMSGHIGVNPWPAGRSACDDRRREFSGSDGVRLSFR